jgi:hypothetical protein
VFKSQRYDLNLQTLDFGISDFDSRLQTTDLRL